MEEKERPVFRGGPAERLATILGAWHLRPRLDLSDDELRKRGVLPPADEAPPCPVCHGTEWVSRAVPVNHPDFGKVFRCKCAGDTDRIKWLELNREWSEIPTGLSRRIFDGFVPTREQDLALREAKLFASGQATHKWLVFAGAPGVGKTHLACAILNWRLKHLEIRMQGKYVNVPDLLADLKDGFRDDSAELRFRRYRDVPLLLMDDLGAHNPTMWAQEQLYRLIDWRSHERMETVMTLNVSPAELPARIRDRVLDEATGLVRIVVIPGQSYRSGR